MNAPHPTPISAHPASERSAVTPPLSVAVERTYRVAHHRDLRSNSGAYGTTGMDWRLYTYGRGHWCIGSGYAGAYPSAAAAHDAGNIWVATGLPRGDRAEQLAAVIEALAATALAEHRALRGVNRKVAA